MFSNSSFFDEFGILASSHADSFRKITLVIQTLLSSITGVLEANHHKKSVKLRTYCKIVLRYLIDQSKPNI